MGEQVWVPLPLCCPAVARFLEEVGLSLEILILVGPFFTFATNSSLVAASLALFATSCSSTYFLLVAAAAMFSEHPYRASVPTSLPQLSVATLLFLSTRLAVFAAPNLSDPFADFALTHALACALL